MSRPPPVLVDTNVASYLFGNGPEAALYAPHCEGRRALLAVQTVAELRVGAASRGWARRRREELEEFLGQYRVVFPDHAIVDAYVRIRAGAMRAGLAISVADTWIAATARAEGVTLVAHDAAFRHVEGLKLVCHAPQ